MSSPWMQSDEILLLSKFVNKNSNILEYGSGASTKWFAENCKHVVSIEHNASWYEKVKNNIIFHKNAEIHFVEPSAEWSPLTDGSLQEFENYVKHPGTIDFEPDLILVDGRARVDCCHFVAKRYPRALIAFHDYQGRANDNFHNYSTCLSSVSIIEGVCNIAIMKSKFHE